ncbi:MAG: TetR/AcrR family transcriptional regulator [Acidobacteria bacterium]|nr:TetR/AcrR family transcriptional regulator [Acidobacteriota bacterium]
MPYPAKTTRNEILDAALEIVAKEGWAALSMRSVAKKLGVQASSLYHHFADRAAMENGLGRRAADELWEHLEGANGLQAIAEVYLAFARSKPELYALIASRSTEANSTGVSKAIWNRLLKEVGAITGDPDDTAGVVALWAFLHGFASLEAAGKFGGSGDRGGLRKGLDALIAGLQAKRHIL